MNPETSEAVVREFLVFSVGERLFAVGLGEVIQIVDYAAPTLPPQRRPYVDGIIEFRGDFLPLINVRKRLGFGEAAAASRPVVVILGCRGEKIGLVVDEVVRVLSQNLETATEPPPKLQGIRAEFLQGVFNLNGRPLLWINSESLIAFGETPSINGSSLSS
jgi:chemotaxis signal transduction protein